MTTPFAAKAQAAIGSAQSREVIVRSEGRLVFLRAEASPEAALVFVRGPIDYWVYDPHSLSRGRCRLKVTASGQMLFSGSVNLDSLQTRRRLARSEIAPKTPGESADAVENDLMLLSDMARQQWAEQLAGSPTAEGYVMTAEEEQEALTLATDPRLLERLDSIFNTIGTVGDHRNRLIIYLALSSRITNEPVSLMMRGESAAGKSFLVSQGLRLMPAEAYEELTEATAKSFYYLPDDCLQHRMVIIFETPGGEAADYTIRSLQSEQKLVIQTTIKDPKTGNFKTQKKKLLGPVGFISTTTKATINLENDTRLLPLYVDESSEQTRRIVDFYAQQARGRQAPISQDMLRIWQNYQRLLRPLNVIIPYSERIAQQFPVESQRVRRDFPRFLALLSIVTLLHQHQRPTKKDDWGEYIEATGQDYAVARFLLEGPFQRAIADLAPRSVKILSYCIKHRFETRPSSDMDAVLDDQGRRLREFTYTALGAGLRWREATVKKWIYPLTDCNYLLRVEDTRSGGRGRKNRFYLNSRPQEIRILADLQDLAPWVPPASWQGWPTSDDGLAVWLESLSDTVDLNVEPIDFDDSEAGCEI